MNERVLVSERNGTRGKFGNPSGRHVWLKGILMLENRPTLGVSVETNELN